ncbi:MAG: DUF488 domain-containing protein [Actinobacteria bacterium]|nr:DUF488 domain-containing protein [Actinomycetota bacterium]
MPEVFTLGHGTRSTELLVEVLRSAAVTCVIDVRRFPASRRHPHFHKNALQRWLPEHSIDYEWGEAFGGRRTSLKDGPTRHPAWRNAAFRAYAEHMETPEFQKALESLKKRTRSQSVSVMCAETLWWRCHRRLIADALTASGIQVTHLFDGHMTQTHELSEFARVDAHDRVIYDVGVTLSLPGASLPE